MLTRLKFSQLKATQSLKCLNCGEFWGDRKNYYICSKCNCIDKQRNYDIDYNKDIRAYQKKYKMSIIDDKVVRHLEKIVQKTFILAYGASDVAKLINKHMQLYQNKENLDNKILLLSDNQAVRLLKASNWREFSDGYKISHIILRWKLNPWSKVGFKEYHPSSFCYYGNYGEVPSTTMTMDTIYTRAHSDQMNL